MSLTENLFIFDDKTSISLLAFFRFLMSSLLFPKIKKQYNQANRLHKHDFIMNSVRLATTVKLGCDAFFFVSMELQKSNKWIIWYISEKLSIKLLSNLTIKCV